jgi:hypothetical protein
MKLFWIVLFLVSPLFADSKNQVFSDFTTPLPLKPGETLVLGVVGGWERWDAEHRIVRRICLRLRNRNLPGVHVETVENHKIALAMELVTKAFDRNSDGTLDPAERSDARLILYGQSLGGSAVVRFARDLNAMQLPILLTVQIDSIGNHDKVIPPNVKAAANLFQRDTWPIVGEKKIVAEDPSRTRILANLQFRYWGKEIDLAEETWVRRVFTRGHTKMEFDPEVWSKVEELILGAL